MAAKLPASRVVIGGVPVQVTYENVPHTSLQLDPDNPRIRLQLTAGGRKKPTSPAELLELMRDQNGYPELQKQIRNQGGISDPLMVRSDGRIVEGNTRFAVVSTLVEKTPGGAGKWGSVPIMRLPADFSEKAIQLQMAGYHIAGKTNWRPSAQADQIYQLLKGPAKATLEEVAEATRMNRKKVEQYLSAYEYLIKEVLPHKKTASVAARQEILESKFSHALQLMTVKKLETIRDDKKQRGWLAKQIAEDKITGAQVRDLHKVVGQPQARAALETSGFKAAKEVLRVVDPAADSKVLGAIRKLTAELKVLNTKDLALFRDHAAPRKALESLHEEVQNVLAFATKPEGKRRA